MTPLFLSEAAWVDRRAAAARGLGPLCDSLTRDLEPWLSRPLHLPEQKALLSRAGGRCPTDGSELVFDPGSPHAHQCPACGRSFDGPWQDRWWVYPYQLWLAERAVHAAVLHRLRGNDAHRVFAVAVLDALATQYLRYPNRDNVLGPSRPFFSTYLESLWLLHLCIAVDTLGDALPIALAGLFRAGLVEPSLALISSYDEGGSNRQVWNLAAIAAATRLLGRDAGSAFAAIDDLLHDGLGEDGAWYEGDNYHQFAHRGLWYGVALGEAAGFRFDAQSIARLHSGFSVAFLTALPDFTYPARKDSRYAASLRQWRFAESAEIGLARRDDATLRWALAQLYDPTVPAGDTERWKSSGEAERPVPAVRLTRADLGWKALLFARETLPSEPGAAPASVTIASQGLTIHRHDAGRTYVALDWGGSGGGHGHHDCLNLLISRGTTRVLDDLGTGSYVDPSLHWYRSTLAHNAPLVGGHSQRSATGWCTGSDEHDGMRLVSAAGSIDGASIERTILSCDAYVIDEVRWVAAKGTRVELPIHFDASCPLPASPAELDGGDGLEDGFDFVTDAVRAEVRAGVPVPLDDGRMRALVRTDGAAAWFTASGPGQPPAERRRFHVVRSEAGTGAITTVWCFAPLNVTMEARRIAITHAGATDVHTSLDESWVVTRDGGSPLDFHRDDPPARQVPVDYSPAAAESPIALSRAGQWARELGESEYRRTDEDWRACGAPTARVAIGVTDDQLIVDVLVRTDAPVFVPAGTENPYDNESADINGHGVQLYLADRNATGGFVLVPEATSAEVRVRRVPGWGSMPLPTATWQRVPGGFTVRVSIDRRGLPHHELWLDLIVNDAAAGRERRRGQLVLSGAAGEWAWLRGDRHDPSRLIPFRIS